jgi:hypothetical protein
MLGSPMQYVLYASSLNIFTSRWAIVLRFAKRKGYSMIKSLSNRFKCFLCKRYYIVYKNNQGEVKTYEIGNINLSNSFGNNNFERKNMGFKAFCFGRKQVRSFRHDRILSITKK